MDIPSTFFRKTDKLGSSNPLIPSGRLKKSQQTPAIIFTKKIVPHKPFLPPNMVISSIFFQKTDMIGRNKADRPGLTAHDMK